MSNSIGSDTILNYYDIIREKDGVILFNYRQDKDKKSNNLRIGLSNPAIKINKSGSTISYYYIKNRKVAFKMILSKKDTVHDVQFFKDLINTNNTAFSVYYVKDSIFQYNDHNINCYEFEIIESSETGMEGLGFTWKSIVLFEKATFLPIYFNIVGFHSEYSNKEGAENHPIQTQSENIVILPRY